jgi:LDH2 family malate/lactate/ureidoglycolate dehydrogenase
VAPWGGRDPVFNTSPMAFAVPAGKELPIIYDGAMSSVSHGHVVLAARDRRTMPGEPLVDEEGRLTGDAVPLVADPFDRNSEQKGAIRALGTKGFGWLILVEVLSSLMAGGTRGLEIPFHQSAERPWTGGFFLMAVNIGALVELAAFRTQVDALVQSCKAARLAEGFSEIVMPGEHAQRTAALRERDGVPLREEDWANLERIAREVGVDLDGLRAG